jgi:outer membrane receptor protein involved in Fe transport
MYTNQLLGFDYQLGLRAEQTDRLLNQKTLGSDYKYNKVHLFPSLNASTKISDAQQIQLSYSRRINRPNEFLLNPFPNVNDAYIYSIGNPELLPELTHSVELNYQWVTTPVFFSVQTYYRNSDNTYSQTQTLESDGRVKLSFGNIAKSEVYGAEISSSISAAQWLKVDPSVNLYNSKVSGIYANEQRERKIFAWSSRLNTTVSFSPVTKFQVMLNYIGKQQDLQSTIDPIVFLTMTLKHDLFDRKLSVSLTAQNLFNAGRFNLTSVGNNFDLIGKIRPEAPVFRLNLSYNFNNFKNTSKNERVDINVNEGL